MPRYLIRNQKEARPLERTAERDKRLIEMLTFDMETAYSARQPQDACWIEGMRQYAAEPSTPVRNQPIPNAPNVEFPLGAIISDSLYAQATDTLFSATPILTVRENDEEWTQHAKYMQVFVNWMANNEIGLRHCVDTVAQDDIQLGTGVIYCPWVEESRDTKVHEVVARMPRMIPIAPSDFLVPGGSRGDHQQDPWCSLRFWYTRGELAAQARAAKWNIDLVKPTASLDQTRAAYERLHRTSGTAGQHQRFEVECAWVYFDYFGDGIDRDLMVVFDRNSRSILDLRYNRFDTRPVETMRYQIRPHLFYGLGVLEMVQPFQVAATEILNHYLLNMMLANARLWIARNGTVDDFTKVWPNRIVPAESTDDIKQLQMADVYPSALMGLSQVISAAERRVGVSGDFAGGSESPRLLGTRTPGITAMTAMQQVNRRFAPAFDGIRLNVCAAVLQCVWRYAERVRMGGAEADQVHQHLTRLMGETRALRVLQLLKSEDFERNVSVEFTAVSASTNREADRSNALQLMQTLDAQHDRLMQTVQTLLQPGVDPTIYKIARKVATVRAEAMEQFLRTFDNVRNPQRLIVNIDEELEAVQQGAEEEAEMQSSIMGQVINGVMSGEVPPETITNALSGKGGSGAPPAPGGGQ